MSEPLTCVFVKHGQKPCSEIKDTIPCGHCMHSPPFNRPRILAVGGSHPGPPVVYTGTLHCGGCDMDHAADGAFVLGHPCPICNWTLTRAEQSKPHHTACPGCGSTVSFTVNDCLAHHAFAGRPCAWNGRQRAVVEQAQQRMREALPTLREWLGDRVTELGRWAEVLREQPVPAGLFLRFEWTGREWRGFGRRGSNAITRADVLASIGAGEETASEAWLEAVQMACFTRHPDVKLKPRPAAFPWDPYPEVV